MINSQMRISGRGYRGIPSDLEYAIIPVDRNGLLNLMRINALTVHQNQDVLYSSAHQYASRRVIVENAVSMLADIIEFLVESNLFITMSNRDSDLEMIAEAMLIAKSKKILFHEKEHKEQGPHWGTATEFYRSNPAQHLYAFLARNAPRGHPVLNFDRNYIVDRGDDSVFVIYEDGRMEIHHGENESKSEEDKSRDESVVEAT